MVTGDISGSPKREPRSFTGQLLVTAQTDAERRAAVETTPARKLREIRMALTLDKTFSKAEILTRYLNLVSFGNGAFGVQDAAQTYFGVNASQLNWQQAALLAGMLRSTSALDPYTNPDGALQRRNVVLDNMIDNLPQYAGELRAAKVQPLGVLPHPNELPGGCIAAGDRGFFCDYVLHYLARGRHQQGAGRPRRVRWPAPPKRCAGRLSNAAKTPLKPSGPPGAPATKPTGPNTKTVGP